MADHGGRETPIDIPGLIARISQAARYIVSSVTPTTWMGPNQPMAPAVPETAGRQWDYPVGANLQIQPRAYEPISFQQLRDLASGYDLLRLLIETRKDQMVKIKWAIKPIDPDQKVEGDARIAELQQLFRKPDGIHAWQLWLREILEEMLVCDAACIYPRMDRGGGLFALELMDGTTIKRVIGDDGRTPLPPDPAYQQVLKGIPASNYTMDELIYYPRNTRVNKLYGYSPVEQIVMTVNIAVRRQIHQLQYYTEGNLPNLLIGVPATWTDTQMERFARIWEGRLNGNTAMRRQAMFIADGAKPYDIKEAALKDEYDEWLARVCCFAFSVSPQPFIKMVNRGNQESAQEAALNEGLVPLMQWVKDLMDQVIWKYKGFKDLEFGWEEDESQVPVDVANIQAIKVKAGIISIDEARLDDGRDPIGMPNCIITATGPVMLKPFIDGKTDGTPQPAESLTPGARSDNGATPPPKAQAGIKSPSAKEKPHPKGKGGSGEGADAAGAPKTSSKGKGAVKFAKAQARIQADRPAVKTAHKAVAKALRRVFKAQAPKAADELSKALGLVDKAEDDPKKKISDALDGMSMDWVDTGYEITKELEAVFLDAGTASAQAMVGEDGVSQIIEKLNQNAKDWAAKRGAELVGKRVLEDGTVIDNPDAKWAITESTREMLRGTVTQAYDEGWTPARLAENISDSYAFSDDRADMIAQTELKRANNNGAMDGYRETGLSLKKMWLLSDDHDIDDPCNDNADEGWIDLDDLFPSGDDAPPNHPNCECSLTVMTVDEAGNETETDEEA